MARVPIHYLFSRDRMDELATWRFALRFRLPSQSVARKLMTAGTQLGVLPFTIIDVTCNLNDLPIDDSTDTVAVTFQVPEKRRHQPNSRADLESDVERIAQSMADCGFGGATVEALA